MVASSVKKRISILFPALNHRNFRLYWFGQCISLIGTWMQNIGQSWLVLQLTDSSFKLGLVSAVQFLPMTLFSLFAGSIIDRLPKKRVLLFTQTALMFLAALLAGLTYFRLVRYWHVLVFATLLGIVNTLDMPARQSFFAELAGKKDLTNAIALNSTIFNLARILGPAVAGFMIGLLGISTCFFINALSFVAVLCCIILIDTGFIKKTASDISIRGMFGDIKEGFTFISSRKTIILPLVLLLLNSIFVMNFNVLVPIFAKRGFGMNASGYGLLMTCMGIGSFTGALTLAAKSKSSPDFKILLRGAIGMSVLLTVLGFENSYILACGTMVLIGFCMISFTALVNSTIQVNSADNMRGRVMGFYTLVFGGMTPFGSLYAGKLTDVAGVSLCMVISGVIGLFSSLAVVYFYNKFFSKGIDKNVMWNG